MFDFWRKSTPFPSPRALVKLRQTAIKIGDTGSLSLISIFSEIVQETSTGALVELVETASGSGRSSQLESEGVC